MRQFLCVLQDLALPDGTVTAGHRALAREMGFLGHSRVRELLQSLDERGYIIWQEERSALIKIVVRVPAPEEFPFELTELGRAALA